MANQDESDHEETEIVADSAKLSEDSDSDFEASGKGKKKRSVKSKSKPNKRRNTNTTPKFNKCHQCRQKIDDNPNLVCSRYLFPGLVLKLAPHLQ